MDVSTNNDSLAAVLDDRLVYIHSSGWMGTKTDMINDLSSGKLIMNKVTMNKPLPIILKTIR